ncbi:UAP56-interacting factor [Oncorhynchus tshawytscha]|uniref:UAP56-interacting factor n=1 Tax=Oncorhynchus tshawytscha TaxID=74940 RepID=UPI000D0A8D87|nr:UAP56-interacting factor [Oncorhynchus tshawytscha]
MQATMAKQDVIMQTKTPFDNIFLCVATDFHSMSNVGFSATRGISSGGPDKVDMSLDDIIRLNKKEQQARRPGPGNRRPLQKGKVFVQGKPVGARTRGQTQRRGGVPRGAITRAGFGRGRKIPPPVGRRRGQGVITGLAARKTAALQKGISPLNRPAINRKLQPVNNRSRPVNNRSRPVNNQSRPVNNQSRPFNNQSRPFNNQSRPFIQPAQYRQVQGQRRPYRQTDVQRGLDSTRPFQQWRRPLPPVQTQREARQATFLSRRGLKVHAQVPKPTLTSISPAPVRTRQWRTSTNSSGILTVSIDNPTAMTQSEPPCAWSLHPSAPTSSAPVKMKVEEEKKTEPPKGVPLQFDINSVGKPTAMTLNERFRILRDERVATAQTSKGSRFITMG